MHNQTPMNFKQVGGDSWVILSPIEQSIKKKIESVGVPLKDWDIQINYGIKTGYNDAFIISTEKREEILSNCKTPSERKRTDQLIRPILRGRDIKRYGYDWAGLYLIAFFPSKGYDIEDYPAVKKHLLEFDKERLIESGLDDIANKKPLLHDYCQQRLEQTGEDIVINGRKVKIGGTIQKSRKRTNNKWFETQDSISYWEEFTKPKIIWKRIGSILRFSYDNVGIFGLDSTCFATGKHIPYLCCVLNSNMGRYLLKDAPKTGTGDLLISVQAIEPLLIPFNRAIEKQLNNLLLKNIREYNENIDNEINSIVYSLYNLSQEERLYVDNYITKFQ